MRNAADRPGQQNENRPYDAQSGDGVAPDVHTVSSHTFQRVAGPTIYSMMYVLDMHNTSKVANSQPSACGVALAEFWWTALAPPSVYGCIRQLSGGWITRPGNACS